MTKSKNYINQMNMAGYTGDQRNQHVHFALTSQLRLGLDKIIAHVSGNQVCSILCGINICHAKSRQSLKTEMSIS